jgi:hypothetical protein
MAIKHPLHTNFFLRVLCVIDPELQEMLGAVGNDGFASPIQQFENPLL